MPNLISPKRHWKLASLLVADLAVFSFTNAGSVPAFVLIVGFIALVMTVHQLFYGLLAAARLYGISFRRKRRLAAYLTLLTGFLVALQSMGELNSRDILVLLPLVVIGYAYSLYNKSPARLPDL